MTTTQQNVLVVGAGPTGMTAALELTRLGIPVRIVDRLAVPDPYTRALGVQARTLELMQQRGLADQFLEKGNQAPISSIYGGGKRVFQLDSCHNGSEYGYLLFISQAETEGILRGALEKAGVTIERPVEMIAFSQPEETHSVQAVLRHDDGTLETYESAYLIASEGAHSISRTTLNLPFEGRSRPEDYALGDLYVDGDLAATDLSVFSSEHGFMGMFPLGGDHFRLIASNPISKPSKDTKPSLDELQQIYDQRSPIPARFHDLVWSSWFHINSRMVSHLQVGRVLLGGDSAHIHSPSGAQGMNTGIQDMVNLSWKLAAVIKGEAQPKLLDTYSEERIAVIRDVLKGTEELTNAIGSENPLFRSAFNNLTPWIVGTDTVQTESAERISQISLNYRKSPLSLAEGRSVPIHPGDRMPDLEVTILTRSGNLSPDGQTTRLFALMDPSCFTILYSNITDAAKTHAEIQKTIGPWHFLMQGFQIAPAGPGAEANANFENVAGSSSSIILVRPDGYVAFTGSEHSVPALAKYCAEWFVPKAPAVQAAQDAPSAAAPSAAKAGV